MRPPCLRASMLLYILKQSRPSGLSPAGWPTALLWKNYTDIFEASEAWLPITSVEVVVNSAYLRIRTGWLISSLRSSSALHQKLHCQFPWVSHGGKFCLGTGKVSQSLSSWDREFGTSTTLSRGTSWCFPHPCAAQSCPRHEPTWPVCSSSRALHVVLRARPSERISLSHTKASSGLTLNV